MCRLQDGGEYVLRVGQSAVTTLNVELLNEGEDAHDTTLTVTLPRDMDLDYLGTDSHVRFGTSSIPAACECIMWPSATADPVASVRTSGVSE